MTYPSGLLKTNFIYLHTTINTVLEIKFVCSKDQMDMSFVWIEVGPGVSNLGGDTVLKYESNQNHPKQDEQVVLLVLARFVF